MGSPGDSAGPAKESAVRVRAGGKDDLPAIQAIYAHHVRHGLASFEETPPDLAEMRRRRDALLAGGYPYLVAERAGAIAGYAHLGPYRPRPAYRYSVEGTVYVAPDQVRRGIGRALLAALIEQGTARGYRRLIAVIGDSANQPSIGLHEALGFERAGLLPAVGFKHGRWVDSVLMQRALGEGDSSPPQPA